MKTGIFAFLGGALAGAAAALLMAPDKGEKTRRKIKEAIDKEMADLRFKMRKHKAMDKLESMIKE